MLEGDFVGDAVVGRKDGLFVGVDEGIKVVGVGEGIKVVGKSVGLAVVGAVVGDPV